MSVTDRISSLTPEQRALFDLLRQKKAKASGPRLHQPPPVPRRSGPAGEGDWPLSFDQERLWFMHRLDPFGTAWNIDAASRMRGPLHLRAIDAALNEIVRRHASWRTNFTTVDGEPVQRVVPHRRLNLMLVDLTGLPEPAREAEAKRGMIQSTRAIFDLEKGPLMRCTFLRVAPEDHVCILTVHHLVTDWIAFQNVWTELSLLYEAALAGRPSPLPELPVQYSDFSVWQREWLQGEVVEELLGYWRRKLQGFPRVLELPTDRPRPKLQRMYGGRALLNTGPELADGLRAMSKREGATIFMTILAVVYALFHRVSGQEKMILGSNNANRNRPELEPLIGYFLTQVPFAVDASGDPTFRELLARVRRVALEAYSYQDLPFGKLIEALQPERDTSRQPLIQSLVLVLDGQYNKHRLPGITTQAINVLDENARYDLMFAVYDYPDGLDGTLEYDADLFDGATATRLFEIYRRICEAAVADPEVRLSRLPVLGEAERHQLLAEWNDTAVPTGPPDLCAHQLVESQVRRSPEAVALTTEAGERLTYAELDERADRLARRLRRLGVGPGALAAVALERSAAMVTALLAVWKAGGAYVPLDPAHPAERLAYILEDSGTRVLLTEAGLRGALPAPEDLRVVEIGEIGGSPESLEENGGELEPLAGPEDLAYVIYTSGSTGRPKGVEVRHGGLVNFLLSMAREPGLDASDVLLAVTTISFDIAGLELWLPLAVGARVALASHDTAVDGARLAAALAGNGVTVLQATPATWRLLLAAGWPGGPDLKALCGGEALPPDLAREVAARTGSLWNVYGPTETTVWSALQPVGGDGFAGSAVPVGRPIADTALHLVDPSFELAPLGAFGEVWIGGRGLARGYLRRPDLTAERFVPDPFGGTAGARLYRTGDLARRLPGGEVEFLGRLDHQVKVRGFRIELGEIEAALAADPSVREAAVLVRQDGADDQRLVAYLVREPGAERSDPRQTLATRLPSYMVPSAFVELEALPLTPSGKVDRRALAARAPESSGPEPDFVEPRNDLERVIAGTFAEVLGVERVGVRHNFFEIGGHSLLGLRMMSRLEHALGVELPLRLLFEAPTAEDLAAVVERLAGGGARSVEREPIPRVPRDADLPLSFAQERLWFLDRLLPGSPAYNMPLSLRIGGSLQVSWLAAAFATITGRHEALRTTFGEREGRPVQQVSPAPAARPLPVVDLAGLPAGARETETLRLAREDALRPFDLARGPLFTTSLLRLGGEEHVLLLNAHHIVTDAWSMGVLVDEMAAFTAGERLPELPVQYPDYAVWQRSRLDGEELERQLAFWRERLAGAPVVLELPTDHPRPAAQTLRGGSFDMALTADLSRGIADLSRRQGATPFMTLLAAWGALMGRLAGQRDLVVGTAIANRDRPELERLIGFFVNTLAVRIDLTDDPSFDELAARTRRFSFDAFAHRDLPLEKLVEALQLGRDRSRQPLIQSAFNLQNAPVGQIEVPGLTLTPLPLAGEASKFDLTLTLSERGGRLGGRLEYAADLFEPATAERWMRAFLTLLASVVEEPGRPVSALPLLSAGARHQVLVEWNDTAGVETGWTVSARFAAQAARAPEAVALVFDGAPVSYGDLDRRAARIAGGLRALGVKPEDRVALLAERSPDLVAALLGVWKAGAVSVPLDPASPAERLAALLADAAPAAVVHAGPVAEGVVPGGAAALDLAADFEAGAGHDEDVRPGSLAYMIYTSGTTGLPKAVAVEHGSLAWTLASFISRFGFGPGDRMPHVARFSFDIALFELLAPLLAGGTCELLRMEEVLQPPALLAAVERSTRVHAVPSLMRQVAAAARQRGPEAFAGLATVFTGGDLVPPELVAELQEVFPAAEVAVLYGPTEATIVCTAWRAPRGARPGRALIGRPLDGVGLLVMDGRGEPVLPGVPGELWIGGPGVARGYFRRDDLTAERFVERGGRRFYRSGDVVRQLPGEGGVLEFLGRTDLQLKVRGFRVEPGEIEAALAAHPEVSEAVVELRQVGQGERQLVAYYVTAGEPAPAELRRFLSARLPAYMVPAAFVPLPQLPLTPHGKVDRAALPAPERAGMAGEAFVPPSTPLETRLAAVCSELLGVGPVGMRDNFFALGGHSLMATQFVAVLREKHGLDVTLEAVFDADDLGDLADRITERELAAADDEMLADMLREMEDLSPEELQELLGRSVGPEGVAR